VVIAARLGFVIATENVDLDLASPARRLAAYSADAVRLLGLEPFSMRDVGVLALAHDFGGRAAGRQSYLEIANPASAAFKKRIFASQAGRQRGSAVCYYGMSHHGTNRELDSFDHVSGWRCPICNSVSYDKVFVTKPGGGSYLTEFFECRGCTIMFRRPGRFTRLGIVVKRWGADVEPKSLREVHGLVTDSDLGWRPSWRPKQPGDDDG
jgi:hypothetical protein